MEPVPATEILSRQSHLQELLAEAEIELALIRQAADLYYYSGTIVDGFLALGPVGEPLLLVRRPQHRLQELELPFPVAFYKDIKDIPHHLEPAGFGPLRRHWPGAGRHAGSSLSPAFRKSCSPNVLSWTCRT